MIRSGVKRSERQVLVEDRVAGKQEAVVFIIQYSRKTNHTDRMWTTT